MNTVNTVTKYKLTVGTSDFAELATESGLFVDKTLFIDDIIEDSNKVLLITRPRRWGKTLNMSMLEYFFSISVKNDGTIDQEKCKQKHDILSKMKIGSCKNVMDDACGKYPVIFISFTGTKTSSIQKSEEKLSELIYAVYSKHKYLLQSAILDDVDKARINEYLSRSANRAALENSLLHLSVMLSRHFDKQVIILIDEYDTPLNDWYIKALAAEQQNIENTHYFQEVLDLFRNMFEAALKNNSSLYKGVMTGILRVAKASLFSGLNNFTEDSILDYNYSKHFGFTEEEVAELITRSGMDHNLDTVDQMKSWYNGYNIGGITIYNPWSIMNWLASKGRFRAYWVGTASTELIENALIEDKF